HAYGGNPMVRVSVVVSDRRGSSYFKTRVAGSQQHGSAPCSCTRGSAVWNISEHQDGSDSVSDSAPHRAVLPRSGPVHGRRLARPWNPREAVHSDFLSVAVAEEKVAARARSALYARGRHRSHTRYLRPGGFPELLR